MSCREECTKGQPVGHTSYPFPPLFLFCLHRPSFLIITFQGWGRPIVQDLTICTAISWGLILWPVEKEKIDLEREPNEENGWENNHKAYPYIEVMIWKVLTKVSGWLTHFPIHLLRKREARDLLLDICAELCSSTWQGNYDCQCRQNANDSLG